MEEFLEAKSSVQSVLRLYNKDQWDGAENREWKAVAGQSPAGKDVMTEAEEYALLGVITKQQLVKT